MKTLRTWVVVSCMVFATEARADFEPAYRLGQVASSVLSIRKEYDSTNRVRLDECATALADMRAKGMKTSAWHNPALLEFGAVEDPKTGKHAISLANAEKLCKEHAQLHDATKDYSLFYTLARDLPMLGDTSLGANWAKGTIEQADKCSKAADEVLAKVPASFPYMIVDPDKKVITRTAGELKPKICDATRKAADAHLSKLDSEEKAYDAKLTKAGITGDKMEWFKHYRGNVFLAGGKEPSDLAKYGAASVWFAYTYSSDPDHNGNHLFTVRRYQFTGTKLAKSSEKTYKRPLGFKSSIGSVMK